MKSALLAFCTACLFAAAVGAQSAAEEPQLWRPFAAGGRIYLDLSAGDYTIKGIDEGRIQLRWHTRRGRQDDRVRADVLINGTQATVRVRGPKDRFRVQIDVPRRADLDMTLTAGELDIRAIEGDKRLSMWAGDVTMEVGAVEQYRRVDASVRLGEVSGRAFGKSAGGLFPSVRWDGRGKYTIDANLFVGELKLVK